MGSKDRSLGGWFGHFRRREQAQESRRSTIVEETDTVIEEHWSTSERVESHVASDSNTNKRSVNSLPQLPVTTEQTGIMVRYQQQDSGKMAAFVAQLPSVSDLMNGIQTGVGKVVKLPFVKYMTPHFLAYVQQLTQPQAANLCSRLGDELGALAATCDNVKMTLKQLDPNDRYASQRLGIAFQSLQDVIQGMESIQDRYTRQWPVTDPSLQAAAHGNSAVAMQAQKHKQLYLKNLRAKQCKNISYELGKLAEDTTNELNRLTGLVCGAKTQNGAMLAYVVGQLQMHAELGRTRQSHIRNELYKRQFSIRLP